MMLHAENETSYLPLIGIRQGGVVKQGRTVELTMSVDLSKAKIRTQHTVALTPVLMSADSSREVTFPPIVIDGKTRHKVYLRAQRLESVELPPFHNDSAQVIIRHSSKGQHYDYAATVPYERWMLDGRIKIREEVHGCVNCDKGKAEQSLWAGILPAYVPDYKLDSIAPEPEPVKVRAETRTARLQFRQDSYNILPGFKNNRAELDTVSNSIELVKKNTDVRIIGIYITGYASPEGSMAHNMALSENRAKALADYIRRYDAIAPEMLHVDWKGEDWEGFKELVSKSNIKDKDLILQVLSMYSSSTQREDEIKNMSSVFNELKKDILPQLRRSVIVNTIDLEGKTDAEMMALVEAGKLDQLNLNELLFVAESIAQDNATKNIVLAYAAEKYNDARAYNNLGIVLTEEGRTADALKCFQKAAQLGEASEALNTNLALANLANGNMAEAQKYAKGADAKAKSLVNAAQGNYNDAAKQLDGMNAAIANTMNKDYAAAKRAIAKDMSAEADYLRAVIASEEGDMRTAEAQLKSAVKKDEKMAKKAMKDIHFKKLFEEGLKF